MVNIVKNVMIMLNRCTSKTASKRAIRKTVEPAGDLIGNKIEEKITGTAQSKKKDIKFDVEKINRNNKRKVHITRKKTIDYWWTETGINIIYTQSEVSITGVMG